MSLIDITKFARLARILGLVSVRGGNLDFEGYLDAGVEVAWVCLKYGFIAVVAVLAGFVLVLLSPIFLLMFFVGIVAVELFGKQER